MLGRARRGQRMPVFELEPDLKPVKYRYRREARDVQDRTIPPDARGQNWPTKTPDKEVLIHSTFSDADMGEDGFGHLNYSEYLCQAFAEHRSIVITPDIVWHTVLAEIASQVKKTPDKYATLFTTTPGEVQAIVLPSGEKPEYFPMKDLMRELEARVPTNTGTFLPDFSTTTPMARFARWTNFAEVCSPYYSYMTLACGFPRIDVQGTTADYQRIVDCALALDAEFASVGDDVLTKYLGEKIAPTVKKIVEALESNDGTFFRDILSTRRCGSGGEIEVDGWWARQMYVKDYRATKPQNLPTHVARITFKNLDTGREFSINAGLFFSEVDGEFTVPKWGWIKNEILNDAAIAALQADLVQPDLNAPMTFEVQKVEVKAKSRRLKGKWSFEQAAAPITDPPMMIDHDPQVIDEIAAVLVSELTAEIERDPEAAALIAELTGQQDETPILMPYKGKVTEAEPVIIAPYVPLRPVQELAVPLIIKPTRRTKKAD